MLLEAKPEKTGRPLSPFHRVGRVCEVLVNWISGQRVGNSSPTVFAKLQEVNTPTVADAKPLSYHQMYRLARGTRQLLDTSTRQTQYHTEKSTLSFLLTRTVQDSLSQNIIAPISCVNYFPSPLPKTTASASPSVHQHNHGLSLLSFPGQPG